MNADFVQMFCLPLVIFMHYTEEAVRCVRQLSDVYKLSNSRFGGFYQVNMPFHYLGQCGSQSVYANQVTAEPQLLR